MHASGQTNAQLLHPTHLSGSLIYAKWYPRLLTSLGCNDKTLAGQATTHKLHPLHRSVFTVTAPLIFAIVL